MKEFLLAKRIKTDLRAVDVAFCDSVSIKLVLNRHPIRYALVESKSREYLAVRFLRLTTGRAQRAARRRSECRRARSRSKSKDRLYLSSV